MPSRRRRLLTAAVAAAAVCLVAFAPSSALAADYCVQNSSCAAGGGTAEPSVDAALAVAAADAAPDRVLIGPGTYAAGSTNGFRAMSNPVQIIGAGVGDTMLTGPSGTDEVLSMNNPASVVSDLTIRMPIDQTPFTKIGLHIAAGSARRISVSMDIDITPVAIGVSLANGALEDSTVDMPTKVAATTTALQATGNATVRNSTLSGKDAALAQGPNIHFERDHLTAVSRRGIDVVDSATNIDATDTLIELVGDAAGVTTDTNNGTDAAITLRNVTIAGDGASANSTGVSAESSTAHSATVTVDSSIIRGVAHSLRRAVGAGAGNILVSFSDLDPAKTLESGTGNVTLGPGNINADPLFAGASDFHLGSGSPAIDSGDPASFADTADLDGSARVLDGTGSGIARRDMGAYEAPAVAPPPGAPGGGGATGGGGTPSGSAAGGTGGPASLALSGLSVSPSRFAVVGSVHSRTTSRAKHGTRFGFQLSREADVRIVIQRQVRRGHRVRFQRVGSLTRHELAGSRSIRFSGRLGHLALKAGSYRAVMTAIDAGGHTSGAQRIAFRVVRG